MGSRKKAGRVARAVSRKSYRTAMRMSKRKLAKAYATKNGQTAYTAVRNKSRRRRTRNVVRNDYRGRRRRRYRKRRGY